MLMTKYNLGNLISLTNRKLYKIILIITVLLSVTNGDHKN